MSLYAQNTREQAGRAGGACHEVDHRAADTRRRAVRFAGSSAVAAAALVLPAAAGWLALNVVGCVVA